MKIEFAVQLNGSDAEKKIHDALKDSGVVEIKNGSVIIETEKSWNEIHSKIEATGRRAVLTGFGGKSCVSIIDTGVLKGVVRFCEIKNDESTGCVIDGVIDGFPKNKNFRINVHESGDLSKGCASTGDVYEPSAEKSKIITSDDSGRSTFRITDTLNVTDLIGRSVVVSEEATGERVGCGIIARSAGIFENSKKICACDGVTIWDERDKPIAGKGRRE